ncbi:hypothetical protein PAL_GLEAN10014906 [Pteropus alecto]|uniref:Uncharacterized protein n=1 Tax=Pteropus alecto TaxID=9402 RepID=L5KPD1_PTEAL|nr:hypothetical protein PAL_GLEAN10014906 [Pteropus alecto]
MHAQQKTDHLEVKYTKFQVLPPLNSHPSSNQSPEQVKRSDTCHPQRPPSSAQQRLLMLLSIRSTRGVGNLPSRKENNLESDQPGRVGIQQETALQSVLVPKEKIFWYNPKMLNLISERFEDLAAAGDFLPVQPHVSSSAPPTPITPWAKPAARDSTEPIGAC